MKRLMMLGRVSQETRAVWIVSKVFDGYPLGVQVVLTCTSKSNPSEQFTAVIPGTTKQAVDLDQYSCAQIG
jgi:hypothetical protein